MAFFLIITRWLGCLLMGAALACFQTLRRAGIYVIAISTGGTLLSLLLSTAVLFLGPKIGFEHFGKWAGVALIGTYILAALAGGVIGLLSGFSLTRRLLPPRRLS